MAIFHSTALVGYGMSSAPSGAVFGFRTSTVLMPPNLQNHLALASEGYLNNQCFGSSSQNVAVGGEGREKHNLEILVCNGDSTSGRCRRTQT